MDKIYVSGETFKRIKKVVEWIDGLCQEEGEVGLRRCNGCNKTIDKQPSKRVYGVLDVCEGCELPEYFNNYAKEHSIPTDEPEFDFMSICTWKFIANHLEKIEEIIQDIEQHSECIKIKNAGKPFDTFASPMFQLAVYGCYKTLKF